MDSPTERAGLHHIVVVGGGAGGLELVTRLGDTLGRRRRARITLVDRSPTHLWKPLLHEVAAGSMDFDHHALDYLAQARWHHFRFQLGEMLGLDRAARQIRLAATRDPEGNELLPARAIGYDTLVIAVGSRTNDFGTPGVREHALSLESPREAELFHQRLVSACMRANAQSAPLAPGQLGVAIIGAGATGVELAAELHNTVRELVEYGFERIDPRKDLRITLIEAAPRILPALPERLSQGAARLLEGLDIAVLTAERVVEVERAGVRMASGRFVPAALTVWAAGVRAPAFLADADGLETNRIGQLVVKATLETTLDPDVFALGDCASCPWVGREGTVPPRAQAAHQQASHLARTLIDRLAGAAPRAWRYRDFGSLVSLGDYSTVGSLMGVLTGGTLWLEGWFARVMYVSLYKMHLLALHGVVKVLLDTVVRVITRRTQPRVKLH